MSFLPALLALPVLAASAADAPPPRTPRSPEVAAVEQELETHLKPFVLAFTQTIRNGEVKAPAFDPAAGIAHFQARALASQGETREACLIAEGLLHALGRSPGAKAALEALVRSVPAESRAWAIGIPLLGMLPRLADPSVVAPYLETLERTGIPEARLTLIAQAGITAARLGREAPARAALAKLQKDFPEAREVRTLTGFIEKMKEAAVGMQAPDFTVPDLDRPGQQIRLADFKGKWLLLDFWGTWCTFCVKELPTTHALYPQFKAKGLEILSLASDAKPELVAAFRRKPGLAMPWRHGYLGKGNPPHPAQTAFNVQSFPSLFLISPDGRIVAKGEDLRETNLEKTLSRFLK